MDSVAKALGKQGSWHCIGACEVKRANQQLLARILPANCCLSADILDRSLCAKQAWLSATMRRPWSSVAHEVLWKAMVQQGCSPSAGHCVTHQMRCQCLQPEADVSGPPCQACAYLGRRMQHDSPLVTTLLTWCLRLRMAKPRFAVHENVKGFQPAVLVKLLGDLYELVSVDAAPSDAGFHSMQRPRMYSILYLRGSATQQRSIANTYRALALAFRQIPAPYFAEFLIATEEELDAAESRLRKRRGFSPLTVPKPRLWEYLLTPGPGPAIGCPQPGVARPL